MDIDDFHINKIMRDYPFLSKYEAIYLHFTNTIKEYEQHMNNLKSDLDNGIITKSSFEDEISAIKQDMSMFTHSMKMKELRI